MSNNDNFNESNYFNKSIESVQSKESKNYKKSAAYKFAVGVLALSLTLTGCGGDKINATEVTTTQVEDYTEIESTDETSSETNETASAVLPSETVSTPEATTAETTTSGVVTTETNPTEVISTEQSLESMYTFDYVIPTTDNRFVPSRFSNGELVDYSVPRTYAAEDYNFKYLNPEQQAEIKKMADMSVEDFRALPQEDQLAYAYWVFENNYQAFGLMLDIAEIDREYKWEVKDAYDIVNNYACNEVFWRTLISYKNPNNDNYDFDAMRKFGSLLFAPDFLAEHDTLVEQIKTNGSTPDDFNIKLTEADYLAEHTLPLIENVDDIQVAVKIEPSELVGGGGLYFYHFERVYFTTLSGEETSAFIITSINSRN